MALVVKDRVKVVSTTTGTGTLTLGAAASGFQDFSVIGDGNTTYYAIVDSAAGDWEVGIGTYTSSGTTLSRDTILESSTGGTAINFAAGDKDVFVTYPAERAVYQDESTGTVFSPAFNASNGILVNSATVSANYTIPTGSNAISAGPVTVASGITVTVPSGSTWVIV
jgi:hypothetical protein